MRYEKDLLFQALELGAGQLVVCQAGVHIAHKQHQVDRRERLQESMQVHHACRDCHTG